MKENLLYGRVEKEDKMISKKTGQEKKLTFVIWFTPDTMIS